MSGTSPSVVLYNQQGIELDVQNNTPLVTGQSALLVAGVNPNNDTNYVPASLIGALGVSELSQSTTVQSAATVTTSGSFTMTQSYVGVQEFALVVSVDTVTGAGSIQYSIQETDPIGTNGLYGNSASTVVINSGNAPGVFTAVLSNTTSSIVTVTWTVTGTFSATISSLILTKSTPASQAVTGTVNVGNTVTVTGTVAVSSVGGTVAVTQSTSPWVVSGTVTSNQGAPNTLINAWPVELADGYGNLFGQPNNPISVTGSISATNPSVGPTASAPPADATYVGALVNTSAPSGYTNGDMYPFSLTTTGLLRLDAHYPVGATTANAPDMGVVGGYATRFAPTYTDSTIQPLSLDGYGNLRVTAVTNKAASSSVTSVAQANTNTVILAPNQNRIFASIYNNTGQKMYIKLGVTANTTNSYSILLMPNSYWEIPNDYQGEIDAIWGGAGGGNALVTELTP